MIGRMSWLGVPLAIAMLAGPSSGIQAPRQDQRQVLREHVAWVADSLRQMQRIKPGMTRADLLELFEPDGGLHTGEVFVFRECPYFKVSVEWEPAGRMNHAS